MSGQCLMEYAARIGGGRRSDHPRSVCPALAALAREVNDRLNDRRRQLLIGLAAEFLGTADTPDAVRVAAVRHSLLTAMRWSSDEHAYPLAVALLFAHRAGPQLTAEGVGSEPADPDLELALLRRPEAAARAKAFVAGIRLPMRDYLRAGLAAAMTAAAVATAEGAGDGSDDALSDMLLTALAFYRPAVGPVEGVRRVEAPAPRVERALAHS
jgi:hypothetical protein